MEMPVTVTETDRLVAGAVRAEIARRRVLQQTLMARTGWSRSFLTRRLHGTVPLSVSELVSIAHALGVDVVDLIPIEARSFIAADIVSAA